MRTDADHMACVRDPTVELLLGHTATVTDACCRYRRIIEWSPVLRLDGEDIDGRR
jgi:hypothetical protein